MDLTVLTCAVYLVTSIALTVWAGRNLSRDGRTLLSEVFPGNDDLAESVNHLLVTGFYLVALGFDVLWLTMGGPTNTAHAVVTSLSVKLGTTLLALGGLHLTNIYILNRIRPRATDQANPASYPRPYPSPMLLPMVPIAPNLTPLAPAQQTHPMQPMPGAPTFYPAMAAAAAAATAKPTGPHQNDAPGTWAF